MDLMARLVSPYAVGGGGNPLRDILAEVIDFERLATGPVKLFITATNVRTGRGRVFRKHEITPDVLLASACLPTMFQAVEIDGEPYWDGGFSGNPTLTPLVRESAAAGHASSSRSTRSSAPSRRAAPATISSRMNEVSFNAVLLKELRMIARAAPGRRSGQRRGRALGADAHPPHPQRGDGEARRLLEAQRRVGVPDHAARRGPPRRRGVRPRRTATSIGVRSTLDLDSLLEGV